MSRYIDADLLQEDFKADHGGKRSLMIDTQPTADVRENVKGEWKVEEMHEAKYGKVSFRCSACGVPFELEHRLGASVGWNFCPLCGADMRGER